MFRIEKNRTGDTMEVKIEGNVNAETAPKLYEELKPDLEDLTALSIDLSEVEYVSSAGLRVFVIVYKTMNAHSGEVKLCRARQYVMDLFVTTGLAEYMNFED